MFSKFLRSVIALMFLLVGASLADPQGKVQIALLLDTSNSMDGLIEQAKSQLWRIVNEFSLASRNGIHPRLQIALYEYGNDGLPSHGGYIRMVTPLTTDLDRISEELFSLKTNGGSEYCGQVIQHAVDHLQWDESDDVLKIIFIAGNEPFDQGPVDYRQACRAAISKSIIVNTIFCGDYEEGLNGYWKEGADLADGKFLTINQDLAGIYIEAPQDSEIARLNEELNDTYLPYGRQGEEAKVRQEEQDANAVGFGLAAGAARAVSKASSLYKNTSWDLVDAVEEGIVDINELDDEDLPEEMQGMTPAEKKQYVRQKAALRKAIQEKIRKLNEERRKYVAGKRREMSAANTLDEVIIQTVHEQAAKKHYVFK